MPNLFGTGANQVPLNSMLGSLAYQDADSINIGNISYSGTLTGGTGVINIGSGQIYKDVSGNVGLGVTPSAWGTSQKAIDIGYSGALKCSTAASSVVALTNNAYYTTNWLYKKSSMAAANYEQRETGEHCWYIAPSGTAGATITWTKAMTLDVSGNLGLGVTPSSWVNYKALQVGAYGNVSYNSGFSVFGTNAYYNGTAWTYQSTNRALDYYQDIGSGSHVWRYATSGTVGTTISWSNAMTLDSNRDLILHGTGATKVQEGTTAQRPASPQEGMIRKNSTLDVMEVYSSGQWRKISTLYGDEVSEKYEKFQFNLSGTTGITQNLSIFGGYTKFEVVLSNVSLSSTNNINLTIVPEFPVVAGACNSITTKIQGSTVSSYSVNSGGGFNIAVLNGAVNGDFVSGKLVCEIFFESGTAWTLVTTGSLIVVNGTTLTTVTVNSKATFNSSLGYMMWDYISLGGSGDTFDAGHVLIKTYA